MNDVVRPVNSRRLQKIGGCVNSVGTGTVPSDPYVTSAPVVDNEFIPFKKHMNVYGMTLLADAGEQKISDDFLCFVAKTTVEMYPKSVPNPTVQKQMISNLYKYKG